MTWASYASLVSSTIPESLASQSVEDAEAPARDRRNIGCVTSPGWERGAVNIALLCDQGLDLADFRKESLRQLRSLLCIDAAFFATVDPATLLFTSALAEEPLASVTGLFLDNEFGRADVNKFAHLAVSPDPVGSLDNATRGDRTDSARYREVIAPLGLGDEVRVALMDAGRCWGVLCLHRERSALGFSDGEIALLRRLAPILAEGLRRGTALVAPASENSADGPGIIILGSDLSVMSINPRAERWLADIADIEWPAPLELPIPIYAAATQAALGAVEDATPRAATRLRRAKGGWITVQASLLRSSTGHQVAIVLDAANPTQLSSLILAAHGLTPAQSRVAALVLLGRSTRHIVAELHISSNTVQEHLHAVFDKFGIGSRRELVSVLSGRPQPSLNAAREGA
jgi:DNA-binding CsgD family transcriptional regulator